MAPRRLASSRGLSAPARVAVALALGVGGVLLLDPNRTDVPLCPLHAVTGLWCPLCGGLRAVDSMARFHFAAAVRDNALLVAVLPFLIGYWLNWVARDRAGLGRRPVPAAVIIVAIAVGLAFTVVRNLGGVVGLRG